jgi:hypothetical protein
MNFRGSLYQVPHKPVSPYLSTPSQLSMAKACQCLSLFNLAALRDDFLYLTTYETMLMAPLLSVSSWQQPEAMLTLYLSEC